MKITVKGKERWLIGKDDKCPICDTPREKIYGTWNIFHAEITSYCCGATYQTTDYHIENPTPEEENLLKMLAGEYIEFNLKQEWIEPLKIAMKELNASNINDDGVIDLAKKYLEKEPA